MTNLPNALPVIIAAAFVGGAMGLGLALFALRDRRGRKTAARPDSRAPAKQIPPTRESDERTAEELRRLIEQADARIAELRRLLDEPHQPGRYRADRPADPRREEILRLSRQGLVPEEIARRLAMNVGEIELIINLQRSGA